jgi:hypothetical protein
MPFRLPWGKIETPFGGVFWGPDSSEDSSSYFAGPEVKLGGPYHSTAASEVTLSLVCSNVRHNFPLWGPGRVRRMPCKRSAKQFDKCCQTDARS